MEYDSYDTRIVEINSEKYLVNGYSTDAEIMMTRPLESEAAILECERDNIQKMLEE